MGITLVFGFAHPCFLGMRRVCCVPLPTLRFCLGVVLKSPWLITCDHAAVDFWLPLKVVQMITLGLALPSVVRLFGAILVQASLMSRSRVKMWWMVHGFKFNLLPIFLNVIWRPDLTALLTLFTLPSSVSWGCRTSRTSLVLRVSSVPLKGLVRSEHLCPIREYYL